MNFIFVIVFLFNGGIHAQKYDSSIIGQQEKPVLKYEIIIPSILIGASILSFTDNGFLDNHQIKKWRYTNFPEFRTKVDDWMQFAPIVMVYGLDLLKIKSKSTLLNQTYILLKAEIISNLLVDPIKRISHIKRPDGSDYYSFPSGHTAQAFMAATFLYKEFGGQSIIYGIAGYSMATMVGLFRILNNKHWVSDVLAGAALGIVSTHLAYCILPLKSNQKVISSLNLFPGYSNGNIMLSMNLQF